jgi:hypothetical protein
MNHSFGRIVVAILIAAAAAFAQAAPPPDPDVAAQARQVTTDRKELAKLAAYVDATSDVPVWSRVLSEFREGAGNKILQGEKLTSLSVARDIDILTDVDRLEKVLANPVPLPDIDPAAKTLVAALRKLAPISHELQNYGASNGFLVDKDAKAHALGKPYMDAVQAVAEAQDDLADRLGARDLRLVAAAFLRAPKDSVLYYAAGMTYYGKRNVLDGRALFRVPENGTVLAAYQKSLEQFGAMATGWEKEMMKDQPQGCPTRMMHVNFFLGSGRQIVDRLQSGEYARRAKKYGEVLTAGRRGGLESDMMSYFDNYRGLVETEDQQRC